MDTVNTVKNLKENGITAKLPTSTNLEIESKEIVEEKFKSLYMREVSLMLSNSPMRLEYIMAVRPKVAHKMFSIGGLSFHDLIPILDEGGPTSTGSLKDAQELCKFLEISFSREPSQRYYGSGLSPSILNASRIICFWALTIQDRNSRTISFMFRIANDDSPLTVGLDYRKLSKRDFLSHPPHITFVRQTDQAKRVTLIYINKMELLKWRA